MAVAIGAPMKPNRMGSGPQTGSRKSKPFSVSRNRIEHEDEPKNQFNMALTGATPRMTWVGTVNRPETVHQKSLWRIAVLSPCD